MTQSLYILSIATLTSVWLFLVVFLFYQLTPLSFWFEYTNVQPTKTLYTGDERPQFYSTAVFRRTVRIQWHDVLMCETATGMGYYSEQRTRDVIQGGTSFNGTIPWQYLADVPVPPATCQVTHNITAIFPFGVQRTQTVVSDPFDIL